MVRLIFRKGNDTLGEREVRRCSLAQEEQFMTDQDGAVTVALEPGIHWFKLLTRESQWLYTVIQIHSASATIEINLQELKQRGHTGPVYSSHRHLQRHLLALNDRFELQEILGRGGMGIVLKARDKMLERWVALKIKHRRFTNHERAKEILMKEAQRLAHLRHPNLIAIYDVVAVDEDLVLITEFVDGLSLDVQLRREGSITHRNLLRYAIQLARVLAYLHESGYVHRDIKPANLMVDHDGALKLIDFGLASPLGELYSLTDSVAHVARKGTPQYMAPEQFLGTLPSAQSDLYQLGVALYEMASGHLPFKGPDWVKDHTRKKIKPLSKTAPHVSEELGYIIERCLAKDPKDRWTSAKDLLKRLQHLYVVEGHQKAKDEPVVLSSEHQSTIRRTTTPTNPRGILPHLPWIIGLVLLAFGMGLWLSPA